MVVRLRILSSQKRALQVPNKEHNLPSLDFRLSHRLVRPLFLAGADLVARHHQVYFVLQGFEGEHRAQRQVHIRRIHDRAHIHLEGGSEFAVDDYH